MTMHLNTQANFHTPGQPARRAYTPGDDFYQLLIEGHRGLDDETSELFNARLVLLLANHIGDLRVLREAVAAARAGLDGADSPTGLDGADSPTGLAGTDPNTGIAPENHHD